QDMARISASLQRITNALQSLGDLNEVAERQDLRRRQMRRTESVEEVDPTPGIPVRQPTLIELYNEAVQDEGRQGEFGQSYPGSFFGTLNVEQRTRVPGLAAEFGPTDRGDFYAFPTEPGSRTHKVVPRFGRALNRGRFEGGAWSEVFECRQYNPERSAQRIE